MQSIKWSQQGSRLANKPHIPPSVLKLAIRCVDQGGRLCVVGGGVRDALLGLPMNDWDIEVYGLSDNALKDSMSPIGGVHEVGKSFKVYKWSVNKEVFDVSIPRVSNVQGMKHRILGTSMESVREASKRRDLTINAISYDPIKNEYLDPYNGMRDLQLERLHPVDKQTFLQDPLRVFRAAQFASRFHFTASNLLLECLHSAIIKALPMERVQGEFFKLFCIGNKPSLGLKLLQHCPDYRQNYGAITEATSAQYGALDTLAQNPIQPFSNRARHWCAALCVWTSHLDIATTKTLLNQLGVFSMDGFNVRHHVLAYKSTTRALINEAPTLRHLSTQMDLKVLTEVCNALTPNNKDSIAAQQTSIELGILHKPPQPLLNGRDLKKIGLSPGPHMGRILSETYLAQMDGTVTTLDEALAYAEKLPKK